MKKAIWKILCLALISIFVLIAADGPAEGETSVITTGTWEGYYLGRSGNNQVRRQLSLCIDLVREDGTFEGIAEMSGQINGTYCVEGTWGSDGSFSFTGTEWIIQPANANNFAFSSFTGTVEENTMTGMADGSADRILSLTKVSDEYISMRIDLDQIPRNWKGEYDGVHKTDGNKIVVRRNYEFHINTIDEDGNVTGTAEFTPSDKAPPQYGYSGAYYFGATINARTGHIHLQGNVWNIKPIPEFEFIELDGTIATDYSAINGTTEFGIWLMEAEETSGMSLYIDDDSYLYTTDGHKYRVYADSGITSWEAAEEFCEGQGGHLATILTQSEGSYILGYLRIENCGSAYFGLKRAGAEGEWSWVTPERYLYSNWASEQPDSGASYGMFDGEDADGKWSGGDFSAGTPDAPAAFICEWEPEGDVTEEFTDPNFLAAVREALGLGEAAPVTRSDCRTLTALNVSGMEIQSLAGIEYLVNLETLNCSSNLLTELDVSSCIPLMDLDCSGNYLQSLDLRSNLYLNRLIVSNNDFVSADAVLLKNDPQTFVFEPQREHWITTGTWEGTYLTKRNNYGSLIQRQMTLYIDRVFEDGAFEGIAEIRGDLNASFCVDGVCDSAGVFSFEGTEWISKPSNSSNLSSPVFTGRVINDTITGTVDGYTERVLSLTRTSDEFMSLRIELDQIPKSWIGEYDGHDEDGTVVRRNYEFHINTIDENGNVTGTAEFTPSDKAPPQYGYSGAYYFGATVSARTGHIHLQGNIWNIKPKSNFEFIVMDGTISTDYSTITGTTEYGIWAMEMEETSGMSLYIDDTDMLYTTDGHRYRVYSDPEITSWEAAKAFCEDQGGHLATITTLSENSYILGYLKIINCENAYFGLTNSGTESSWRWVTGERYLFSNWASEQPDIGGGENCGMFSSEYTDGKWSSGDFSAGTPEGPAVFICEWEPEGDVTEAFKDPNFLAAIREALGLGSNAPVMQSACRTLTALNVSGRSIQSLAGIKYLVNLESLNCSSNLLTELDVSSCIPLMDLDCSDNLLQSLDLRETLYLSRLVVTENDFLSAADILRNEDPPVFVFDPQHVYWITTGTWQGSYLGKSNNNLVERPMTLYIDQVDEENGTFEGIAELTGELACSYFFDGQCEANGTFSFQGTEFIIRPSGSVNFSFSDFAGRMMNDTMTGLAGGDSTRTLSLTKTSDEFQSMRIELDQIPTIWKGVYDGRDEDGTVVRRNYEFRISRIDENGEVTGTAQFTPSEDAPSEYGCSGAYYFGASVRARNGHITLQGTSWSVRPTESCGFIVMEGTISTDYSSIEGTTENGIWRMEPAQACGLSLYTDDNDTLHTADGRRYRVYDPGLTSWEAAKAFCEDQGGHLATITTQSENNDILGYLKIMNCVNAYFGLTDSKEEGVWRWVTGERYAYSNWASGQPDNGSGGENYGMFCSEYADGEWSDGDFGASTPGNAAAFICEWDAEENVIWSFIIPENLTVIEEEAFMGTQAKAVRIPGHCTTIASGAFADSALEFIYLPESVTSIAADAFPENTKIYTPRGSHAAEWGREHEYWVIEE